MVCLNERRCIMPKFLALANYTPDGVKALAKEGGSKRRAAIAAMYEKLGGKLEVFSYAFGEYDVIAIGDVPDNVTAAAMSLAINATGLAKTKTILLMTPEEMDKAAKVTVDYQPPG
jgi:uncharacterized protein with GYD domain